VPWQATTDSLRFWDVDSAVEQSRLDAAATLTMVPRVAWSHARNTLAAASRDGSLWAWDMGRREIAARLFLDDRIRRHIEAASTASPALVQQSALARNATAPLLAFSPDGSQLATVDREGVVKFWDTSDWHEILTLPSKHADPYCLFFSPDGATLVVNDRGQAKLYDPRTGDLRPTFRQETESTILWGQFSPDGKVLALGAIDGSVRCVDMASRSLTTTLVGHVDGVASLMASAN
jgi:WD40 repeat protein